MVLAAGVTPVNELAKALEGSGMEMIVLGDADKPGKIEDAIKAGV